jgi:hypothetical protein
VGALYKTRTTGARAAPPKKGTICPAFLVLACLIGPSSAAAHDIPNDVTVQTFLKPSGRHLELLMRVPMKAMRDVVFPEKGPGYLDLEKTEPLLSGAATLWLSDFIDLYEADVKLPKPQVIATRISLESDRSFADFDSARAVVTGPRLPPETNVVWNQTYLDVLFEYPIHSDQSLFSIHARLQDLGLRVLTTLRFIQPSGTIRAFEFEGNPGLVRLDPRWFQAAARFVESGFFHILDGTDHLLFLFCLVIPFRKLRALIPIVTSFTVAHSITLIASAYDLAPDALWFPPLIETLIACSIVYMALENIVGTANVHRRWIITFGFGLVHGFGFSFALRQTLQFGGSHMLTSLLAFNVGVELGQLLVLILLIPVLDALFRYIVAERMGTIIVSALIAHTAWHWMIDRGSQLQKFPLRWPDLTPAFFVSLMHWAMVGVLLAGLLWLFSTISRKPAAHDRPAALRDIEPGT